MYKNIIAIAFLAALVPASAQQFQPSTPMVVGAPQKASVEPNLKYRDPSKPLTIGEMSDLQAADEVEKFMKRHGFTTRKPDAPKSTATTAAQKPVAPPNQLRLLAVFGTASQLKAEVAVNGVVRAVERPMQVGAINVAGIAPGAVQVLIPKKNNCARTKRPGCQTHASHTLRVGDIVEWR